MDNYTTFSISELTISKADFSFDIPKDIKLRADEKTYIVRRQIENILNAEDMRYLNRKRYNEYIKDNKLKHNQVSLDKWLKCKEVKYKKMEKIPLGTFVMFCNKRKFSEEQLYRILSECQDLKNRKGSPNLYAWSLSKRRV